MSVDDDDDDDDDNQTILGHQIIIRSTLCTCYCIVVCVSCDMSYLFTKISVGCVHISSVWCVLTVEITMTGLHVVLCVEYLLQLTQFFIQGMSVMPEMSSATTPSGLSHICASRLQSVSAYPGQKYHDVYTMVGTLYQCVYEVYCDTSMVPGHCTMILHVC